jgi:hypothetical protein
MIRWYMRIDREVVEQRTLFDLPWSHHRLSSCLNRTESMSFRPFNQRLFQQNLRVSKICGASISVVNSRECLDKVLASLIDAACIRTGQLLRTRILRGLMSVRSRNEKSIIDFNQSVRPSVSRTAEPASSKGSVPALVEASSTLQRPRVTELISRVLPGRGLRLNNCSLT